MKRRLLFVLAILVLALAACRAPGGGGGSSQGAEPSVATSEAPVMSEAPAATEGDPYDY